MEIKIKLKTDEEDVDSPIFHKVEDAIDFLESIRDNENDDE